MIDKVRIRERLIPRLNVWSSVDYVYLHDCGYSWNTEPSICLLSHPERFELLRSLVVEEVAASAVRANARLMEGLARNRLKLGMLGHFAQLLDSMRELTFVHEATLAGLGEALAHFCLVAGSVELRAVKRTRGGH